MFTTRFLPAHHPRTEEFRGRWLLETWSLGLVNDELVNFNQPNASKSPREHAVGFGRMSLWELYQETWRGKTFTDGVIFTKRSVAYDEKWILGALTKMPTHSYPSYTSSVNFSFSLLFSNWALPITSRDSKAFWRLIPGVSCHLYLSKMTFSLRVTLEPLSITWSGENPNGDERKSAWDINR